MVTYYTCTEVTPEVYDAYVKYKPNITAHSITELRAVALCHKHGEIMIYPVSLALNIRHLTEFWSTDPKSRDGDVNILMSVEEFFSQLFMLELEQ